MAGGTPSSPLLVAALARAGDGPTLPANSRYQGVPTRSFTFPDGRAVTCFVRRLVPPPERFATLEEHVVKPLERLDLIAAERLGDPELYWRLCDANRALDPAELEAPGRRLRITLPDGIPGASGA